MRLIDADAFERVVMFSDDEDIQDVIYRLRDFPTAQPERLTDDDFETIRIHLSAYKEKLCNQNRWKEAEEYQRIIDRFMSFASAQPEYEPVTAEDFAKTMSMYTFYSFITWHGEALELMGKTGVCDMQEKEDVISRQLAVETIRKCAVKEVTPAYMLIDRAEGITGLMMLPSAQPKIKCIANITMTDEQVQEVFEKVKVDILATQPERKKGMFIGTEFDGYADGNPAYYEWICSECGCTFEDEKPTYNFCPNCGCEMER